MTGGRAIMYRSVITGSGTEGIAGQRGTALWCDD